MKSFIKKCIKIKNIVILCLTMNLYGCVEKNMESTENVDGKAYISESVGEEKKCEDYMLEMEDIYTYKVDEKYFSFFVDDRMYTIPYAQISGCPNSTLEWKVNKTLWEEACWIFDCAEIGTGMYGLFEEESSMQITGIYQCGQFLSVVYDSGFINRLPGNIVYAIVIDTLTGERILLDDMIKDKELFSELLLHYFDDDEREIRLFIDEEKVEVLLNYSGMTEDEIVENNITFGGENLERLTGEVNSISYLFDATSFYMTEDNFVVLPGANYYEPLVFDWENVSEAICQEKIKNSGICYD